MIKILIADDQELMRQSLKMILGGVEDFEVTDAVSNGTDVIRSVRENKPDVILMDVRMPKMDGVVCTKIIKENTPDIKIIILTTFDDYELVQQALKNGAKGYLIKNHTPEHLKQMIKSVYNGTGVMEESILQTLAGRAGNTEDRTPQSGGFDPSGYSERELDIVRAVAEGLSNKEIAAKLYISEGTVKNYITNILAKENLSHRTALAVYYLTGKK